MSSEEKIMQADACIDAPSKTDYRIEDFPELFNNKESGSGISNNFPVDKFTVFNQGDTPACTRYWLWHIINAYNINEWDSQWELYTQINPSEPWIRFCKERWYSNKWATLQSALEQWKKELYIAWYIMIADLEKAKEAIDKGYYIYTWSSNGDWSKTKKTWIYTLKTDGKFVWHAWNIIDRDPVKWFKCTNSYGWTRWKEKWFFWLPYNMWDTTYSKYIVIDKNDEEYFTQKKNTIKARELLMTLKSFYTITTPTTQKIITELGKQLRIDYPDLQSIK